MPSATHLQSNFKNLSKRGFCPATNFAFRDMICVHQVFVRNSNGADAQHEECGHDLLFALFYSTNHQPPLAPEYVANCQTKISYNKKLLVQCGSSNLTSKSREDYKHWTQDPRTQGPGTQGPRTQEPRTRDPRTKDPRTRDPRTQGPKDQGPKDPRTKDPRTKDPRSRDLRTGDLTIYLCCT